VDKSNKTPLDVAEGDDTKNMLARLKQGARARSRSLALFRHRRRCCCVAAAVTPLRALSALTRLRARCHARCLSRSVPRS
jgi:hypothetical protein